MKTLFRFIIYIGLASFILLSCSKQDDVAKEIRSGETLISFRADVSAPKTKATLTTEDENSFKAGWESTDKIALWAISEAGSYMNMSDATWNIDNNTFEGSFSNVPQENVDWEYLAYYPWISRERYNIFPFGSNRKQKGNLYNSKYDIMAGQVRYASAQFGKDGNGNDFVIPMQRFSGIAYFHITGGPDENVISATLEVGEGGIAAEEVEIKNGQIKGNGTNEKNSITITFEDGTAPKATNLQLWFNVIPGTYNGMTLTIKTETKQAVLHSNRDMVYAAGKLNKAILSNLNWGPVEGLDYYYTKITSNNELTDGQYLIVYEEGGLAFNGGLETLDAVGNTIAVIISDNKIAQVPSIDNASFTYNATNNTLFSASGFYIGQTSDANGLASSKTEAYENSISFDNVGNANIVSGGAFLRYNSASNQTRFRYYKSSSYTGQKVIALYKLSACAPDARPSVTLSFTPAEPDAINLGDEFTEPTLTVSPAAATVRYSITTSPENIASINESTGKLTITDAGEITVTASVSNTDAYKPASASYTLIVNDPTDYVTLPWQSAEEGYGISSADLNAIKGVTVDAGSDYSSGPCYIKFDATGRSIIIKTNSQIGSVSVDVKGNGTNDDSKIIISGSSTGESWTEVQRFSLVYNSITTITTSNDFASDARLIKIEYFKSQGNAGVGRIFISQFDPTPRFTVESPLTATAVAGNYTVNIVRKNYTGALTVTVPSGCNWITADNVGENATSFSVHVDANTSDSRTATLTISGNNVASQELVVKQAGTEPGSEARPYTVAQALDVISTLSNNTKPDSEVYVSGTISQVDSYNSNYHSITYYISDDGTTTNHLQVYGGLGLNGNNFTDITNLAVGDQVVIKGYLYKFYNSSNSTTIPEMYQNSIITSITQVTRYTITLNAGEHGSLSANSLSVGAQGAVTITINPDNGYELDVLTVGGDDVTSSVSNNKYTFTMPASNVTVSATFAEQSSGGGTTVSMSSFSSISGNVGGDPNVSYLAAKGNAGTAPAVNNGEIRVYQNGGLFTVTANNNYKITSITIGSSMGTTVTVTIDEDPASDNKTINANGTITESNLNASSVMFTCTGTDKSHRLYVNYLSVTYE